MDHQTLVRTALDCGAFKAAVIRQEQIVLSASFREICASNGCGIYGKCWMCPPAIGEIGPLMEQVRSYPRGLLYQIVTGLEDSFDIEGMGRGKAEFEQLSLRIQKEMKELMEPGFLHLTGGGCSFCDRCAILDGEPCRHPDLALPPMEGYGIDVYNTSKSTDLKYINGQNTVTFFGLVLFGKDPVCQS